MDPRAERALRWFLGLSLLAGSIAIFAGAAEFRTLSGASPWVIPAAGVVAAVLAIITASAEQGPWTPAIPATAWIVAVLSAIVAAHVDPQGNGHAFLSVFAATVAFATGIGILRRQLWAWPVGFASVAGFGPIVLILAPLAIEAVVAGFVLFAFDVLALLAIQRSYFGPR